MTTQRFSLPIPDVGQVSVTVTFKPDGASTPRVLGRPRLPATPADVLRYYEASELSYDGLAEHFGCSRRTVAGRLAAARFARAQLELPITAR